MAYLIKYILTMLIYIYTYIHTYIHIYLKMAAMSKTPPQNLTFFFNSQASTRRFASAKHRVIKI